MREAAHQLSISISASQAGLGNVTNDSQLKRADGDLNTFTEKTTPIATDIIIIEDSAASYAKKKVQISNLPSGGGGSGGAPLFYSFYAQYGNIGESQIVPAGSCSSFVLTWETLPTISTGDSWGDGSTANTGKLVITLYKRDRADDDTSLGSFSSIGSHTINSSTLASHYTEVVSMTEATFTSGDEVYADITSVTNSATITLGLGLSIMLVYS